MRPQRKQVTHKKKKGGGEWKGRLGGGEIDKKGSLPAECDLSNWARWMCHIDMIRLNFFCCDSNDTLPAKITPLSYFYGISTASCPWQTAWGISYSPHQPGVCFLLILDISSCLLFFWIKSTERQCISTCPFLICACFNTPPYHHKTPTNLYTTPSVLPKSDILPFGQNTPEQSLTEITFPPPLHPSFHIWVSLVIQGSEKVRHLERSPSNICHQVSLMYWGSERVRILGDSLSHICHQVIRLYSSIFTLL